MCRHPLVSDYPHICFFLDLVLPLLLMLLLLSRSAHGHAVRLKIPFPLCTVRVPTTILPSRGFGCCTPKTTSSPRHHFRDIPPSQARPPPVTRPCPPAMRTYCSPVLSLHTFHRTFRYNCFCSGPQPFSGSISSSNPSLSLLHRLNWRCRCLPCLFHAPFHPSPRSHSLLCRRAQAILTTLTRQKMGEASRICCEQDLQSPSDSKLACDSGPKSRASTRQQARRKRNMLSECCSPHSFPRCLVWRAKSSTLNNLSTRSSSTPILKL